VDFITKITTIAYAYQWYALIFSGPKGVTIAKGHTQERSYALKKGRTRNELSQPGQIKDLRMQSYEHKAGTLQVSKFLGSSSFTTGVQ
jgi:hypothetical protein